MGKYMKCPRCELNWILEADEYCDVCKAELGMEGFTLLEDEEEDILCPVCGINYIERNKKMCADCLAKSKGGNSSYVGDSDSDSDIESQIESPQTDTEEGIEKISFDEIDEEEKFDIYDDAFDDQDDFSANDFGKEEFDEEEESEEDEEVNKEDDEFEADFNYDIDSVEDIDEDEEEDLDDIDED
ncbi:MAG: hypothetical protein K2O31_00255 [Clostridia bacterium]|nr:hypothetical protein [Clostridia bacterium]